MKKMISLAGLLFCIPVVGMESPLDQMHRSLLEAIRAQNISQVEKLLKAGANPNYFTDIQKNDFPLRVAAATMNIEMVQLLLNSGADPGVDEKLICAIYQITSKDQNPRNFLKQRERVLIVLVNHGRTNVNCINSQGDTPLIKAIKNDDKDLIIALLKTNRVDKSIKDKQGRDVQFHAQKSNAEIKKMLGIEKKRPAPEPELVCESGPQDFKAIIDALNRKDIAAVLNYLNSGSFDINYIYPKCGSIFSIAIDKSLLPVVQRLVHMPELKLNIKNAYGLTPLMRASISGSLEIIRALLERKDLLVNELSPNNKTALDFAMAHKSGKKAEIPPLLRAHGAKTAAELRVGPTPQPQSQPPPPAPAETTQFTSAVYAKLGLSAGATPYEVLGVDPTDSQDKVTNAFRRKTLEWHPDKNPDPMAKEVIQLINWAYEKIKK